MNICNSRVQIFDLDDNLLVDDICIAKKLRELMNPLNGEGILISFDNKHFFNLKSKELKYKIINDNKEFEKKKFDIKNFSKYKTDLWHKICFDKELIDDTVVIYREYDIYELDPEVKELVNTINRLPYCTTISSCSGHNKFPLCVTCRVSNIFPIELLAKIVYDNFNKEIIFTTSGGFEQDGVCQGFSFNLQTKHMAEEAYRLAEELRIKIDQYIDNDLENDLTYYYKNKDIVEIESIKDINEIENKLTILEKTLNEILGITDVLKVNDAYICSKIDMTFYDRAVFEDFVNILSTDFRDDFSLRINISNNNAAVKDRGNNVINCSLMYDVRQKGFAHRVELLNDILLKHIVNKNDIQKEIVELKNTLNKVTGIIVNDVVLDDNSKYRKICLIFNEIKPLYEFLNILWIDFKDDFILTSDSKIMYIDNNDMNNEIRLTLEFVMPSSQIVEKLRALNSVFLTKINSCDAGINNK